METAAWKLLEKPWKGLLLVALDKEEVKPDASNNRTTSRRMRNRGRRGRNTGTEDWVESVESLLVSNESPGYRLSAMLVQRARLGTKWDAAWDAKLEALRDTCLEGVHPVWLNLSKETPLLAEMSMYPKKSVESTSTVSDHGWVVSAAFDPENRQMLGQWLEQSFPFQHSAEIELNMQNICLLYTSPSPRDLSTSRMPSSA